MRDILGDLDAAANNPIEAARQASKAPLPKRFYTDVTVEEAEGGFTVALDGRGIKTPGQKLIVLPQLAAQALRDEFDAQTDFIDPKSMPHYRLLNTALDGVATDMQAVAEDVTRFAGSDLLCYRADGPETLVARQNEAWDPFLDWIAGKIGSRFVLAEGVMHVAQPKSAIAGFGVLVGQVKDPIMLAALHSMTTLTGSAIMAYAVFDGAWDAEAVWAAAHVDEDFNIEQWGDDGEAAAMRAWKWQQMKAAALLIKARQER
ncbi:MAG: ATP12 family protein [Pseudomonadota bacterium]